MRRRELIALLGGAALIWPLGVRAQRAGRVFRIGYFYLGPPPPDPHEAPPWPTLRKLGYVEGTNLVVERRFAAGRRDMLATIASEFVASRPDVILAQGYQAAEAASKATHDIPIVVLGGGDPIGTGLVKSLARPGANITGVTEASTELSAKRLELLKEAIPAVSRVAVLWNAADRAMTLRFDEIEAAAKTLQVAIQPLGVREPEDFDDAFAAMRRDRPDAMFMITDALTNLNRKRIVEFAAEIRLPAVYEFREPVFDGGLMSYGPNMHDLQGRVAYYIDKILKGAKPGDLPMEQPTKFELVVNLKTAKALGLTIPPSILARADEVIE
ncbi:ABC transporter substrate-binding protein [Aliidongia dinghuensis]|nr:ABC transporter substrate-binding protein [Aliidongia dinghuensis]